IVDHLPEKSLYRSRLRLDAERFFPIAGWTNFFARIGIGRSFSPEPSRDYYLFSAYTLRPVPAGDEDFLLGKQFLFSTLEMQYPLNSIIRIPLFNIEGILGLDFGG